MRTFDEQLLRLKQAIGKTADQDVAQVLGMTKAAFSDRKKRGAFPEDKVRALAATHPDLDIQLILSGESDRSRELNRRLALIRELTQKVLKLGLPMEHSQAVQALLFSVELEDAAGVRRVLEDIARGRAPKTRRKSARKVK